MAKSRAAKKRSEGVHFRVYLDACCVNRPFDDQEQDRIRLESEAVYLVLRHVQVHGWTWVGSDILKHEILAIPDLVKREQVQALLEAVTETVQLSKRTLLRAGAVESKGFSGQDALHLACAEQAEADVFLTTDDRLLRRAVRRRRDLSVRVANPVDWIREVG